MGTTRHFTYIETFLKVLIISALLCTPVFAGGDEDSARVPINYRPDHQFPDSLKSFSLNLEPSDTVSNFSATIGGMIRFSTNDANTGYGATFGAHWHRFSPLLLRAAADISFYDSERPEIEGFNIFGLQIDMSLLLSPLQTRARPYLGGGLTFYIDHTDEDPRLPPGDFYEEGIVYGSKAKSGFGVHLRGGTDFQISANLRLWLDIKYAFVRPDIVYHWDDPITRTEQTRSVELNMEAPSIALGVTFPIK